MGSAAIVAQDTTTQGSWVGVYGSDGYYVVGDTSSIPSYASYTLGTWGGPFGSTSTDTRALQEASNHSVRTAALLFSSAGSSIDITITGGTKQVSLYMWAGDSENNQSVQVLDMDNGGAVLSSFDVLNYFSAPRWLVFNVSGHVQFKFLPISGSNPCRFNGFFFDPAGTPITAGGSASFVLSDDTTQGDWVGAYGADGYNVVTDDLSANPASYPTYVTVTPSGEAEFTFDPASTDARALQLPSNHASRVNAVWFGDLTLDLVFTGGSHAFSIYFWDGSNGGRAETVTVADGATNLIYDSRSVSGFYATPVYLVWSCSGHITVHLTLTAGANAVLNGLFFDGGGAASVAQPVCFIIT